MIITISGQAGAGKSTAVKAVAAKLGWPCYGIGQMRRMAAAEKDMTIEEFNKWGEDNVESDKIVDDYQIKLGQTQDNIIVDGRLSWYFIPNSLKIFLTVDPEEAARRVYSESLSGDRAKEAEHFSSEALVLEANRRRMESDQRRYLKYYGIDPYDSSHYDLVVDTTDISLEETFGRLMEEINKRLDSEKLSGSF